MWKDGWALSCKRFHSWCFNTLQRQVALGPRKAFWAQNPGDRTLDVETLSKEKGKNLAARVVGVTANIPGPVGEKLKHRGDVETMLRQIEWETAKRGGNDGKGRIPRISQRSPLCNIAD